MAIESYESFPEVPDGIDNDAIGPIVHRFLDGKRTVDAARDAARPHPDYMSTAFKVAAKLYPYSEEMRQAFLSGTELIAAIERQKNGAKELQELLFSSTNAADDDASGQLPASA